MLLTEEFSLLSGGKREAEDALEKLASTKKQKKEVVAKKVPPPKKAESSSSEDESSESESEEEVVTLNCSPPLESCQCAKALASFFFPSLSLVSHL